MRPRTSASQACGSISFILAVTMRLYITAARSPIGAAEQPRLPTQSDATHAALGGIVGQTDAAIVEEARERDPTLEHVVHGLGDVVAARELGALLSHPGLQIGDQRRAELLSNGATPFRTLSVDRPLDLEQLIDPTDRFQRQRRDRRRLFALRLATGILGQIRHYEERPPGMDPTGGFQDRTGRAAALVKLAIAFIGVSLGDPGVVGQMSLRMFAGPVTRVIKHRPRRRRAAKRLVVPHV